MNRVTLMEIEAMELEKAGAGLAMRRAKIDGLLSAVISHCSANRADLDGELIVPLGAADLAFNRGENDALLMMVQAADVDFSTPRS